MGTLNYIRDCFKKFDTSIEIDITNFQSKQYYYCFDVENAIKTSATEDRLISFFGGRECEVHSLEGTQKSRVLISKVTIPRLQERWPVL
jgi:hypothetical protein